MKTEQPKPNSKPPFQTRPQPSTISPPEARKASYHPKTWSALPMPTVFQSSSMQRARSIRSKQWRKYPDMGADLIGYGAKYIGSCHSTGILCGRKDLIDAAYLHFLQSVMKPLPTTP